MMRKLQFWNMMGFGDQKTAVEYSAVPWAIFTNPQVGHWVLLKQKPSLRDMKYM
jgi:pyruvate/2-oxoglutarate dehydrogenase complex dihydrolipoamide dehydrogenase (E3) component